MGLSKFSVRCIKQLSPECIAATFDTIVAFSYTDEEYAAVVVLSNKAAEHSF